MKTYTIEEIKSKVKKIQLKDSCGCMYVFLDEFFEELSGDKE